jgi:glycosyltransferase involved in cell wall biosynthesis
MPRTTRPLKIAVVTCYDQNDYVRARTLRTAFAACPDVETIVVKNKHKGLLRYPEVAVKILALRFTKRPDAYVVTFRGYEMLLYLLLSFVRKPIIFDELINFVEYFFKEHQTFKSGTAFERWVTKFYGWQLKRCRFVLADTQAHADYSAALCRVPEEQFRVIPIGTDEKVFHPQKVPGGKGFDIFYYGNGMTPLHGLQYVLDAAVQLKDKPHISFTLVGGHEKAERACAEAVAQGAKVTYKAWVPFEEIPQMAAAASLCLGGPFGKTVQSQFVVTGKTVQFLACARPVLVGENEVSQLFQDRKNCLLVPPADVDAIVQAITWAAGHPKELASIAKSGRELHERHFSQDVINRLVRDIVKELS